MYFKLNWQARNSTKQNAIRILTILQIAAKILTRYCWSTFNNLTNYQFDWSFLQFFEKARNCLNLKMISNAQISQMVCGDSGLCAITIVKRPWLCFNTSINLISNFTQKTRNYLNLKMMWNVQIFELEAMVCGDSGLCAITIVKRPLLCFNTSINLLQFLAKD